MANRQPHYDNNRYDRDPRDPRERVPRDPRDARDPREARDPRDIGREQIDPREQRRIDPRERDQDRMDIRDPSRIYPRTTQPSTRTNDGYFEQGRGEPAAARFADEQRDAGRRRAPIDLQADRREENFSDYFLPGEDINREVIQYDICRYLGNDATVRPYQHPDGRHGYIIKAYRAPTSAMIATLKQDSRRFESEQVQRRRQYGQTASFASSSTFDDRQRQGRPDVRPELAYGGGGYTGYQEDQMDVDDYDPREPPRGYAREQDQRIDPRQDPRQDLMQDLRQDPRQDPRQQPPVVRHGPIPVTQGYSSDPPYPASYVPQPAPPFYNPNSAPRTMPVPGSTTPPTQNGRGQPAYPGGYPISTSAPPGTLPPARYTDASGRSIPTYAPQYPGGDRHDRR